MTDRLKIRARAHTVSVSTWQHGEAASMSYVYMVPSWCQLPSQRDLHLMQTILWTPSKQSTQMAYRCINLPVGRKNKANNQLSDILLIHLWKIMPVNNK